MNCPKCNRAGCDELAHEVDIGVGVMKHVYGYECAACGPIAVCVQCGALDPGPHHKWCVELESGKAQENPDVPGLRPKNSAASAVV